MKGKKVINSRSFESTVESHLNVTKELSTFDAYESFILNRVNERLTNDYFDITLLGSDGLTVPSGGQSPGRQAWTRDRLQQSRYGA